MTDILQQTLENSPFTAYLIVMGRHKLNYKLKKPNKHHLYWRYVLITDPSQSEISTKTKVKYEAERIAKEAYAKAIQSLQAPMTFGEYAADFFSDTCKLTARKRDSAKPVTKEMITMKRGQLLNYLMPQYKDTPLTDITAIKFEDWRQTLKLAKSTRNGITGTFKQILAEAVRDKKLLVNPLLQVECLSKEPDKPRDSLSVDELAKLFPLKEADAIKIWGTRKYHTLMFLLVSSGMRSGEARALRWNDVVWDDSGVLITKAMKITGKVGSVKEKKEKVVRLAQRTMQLLEEWKAEAKPTSDEELIFWGIRRGRNMST